MARPKLADQGKPARDRIIASAEQLFAEKGVHLTSYREVARAAGVNSNLVAYHFPERADLFSAVIRTRSDVINDQRLKLLTAIEYRYSPNPPPVEEIARAFVHPVFEFAKRQPEAWRRHGKAIIHAHGSPLYRDAVLGMMHELMRRFASALQRSIPTAKRADILFILELMFVMNFLPSRASTDGLFDQELSADREDTGLEARIVRSLTAAALAFA